MRFAILVLALASLLAWCGSAAALVSDGDSRPAPPAPEDGVAPSAPEETARAVESLALYPEAKIAIQVGSLTALNAKNRIAGFKKAIEGSQIEIVTEDVDQEDAQVASRPPFLRRTTM